MTELTRRSLLVGTAAVGAAVAGTTAIVPSAKASAPVAGKQNAGWYRYKVGEFEVTVVTDGQGSNPLGDSYVVNTSKDSVAKDLEAQFLPKDKVIHTYTPVVINTGSKLVAIDTGLGLGTYAQSKGALGQYHTNLKAAGIDANNIDVVIISHFHGDHINGLIGPDNKPMFSNAEIMVPETEWAFWMDESNVSKLPEVAKGQIKNPARVFGALGNKVTKYQDKKELVPGITAMFTPGHTHGHHSHIVSSGNNTLIVQADVTAGAATLFMRNPDWQFVFDSDKPTAVATRKKLYEMASADKMMVQGFHLPFPAVGYIEKSGNGYRYVPATWLPSI
jgi:glyoxylase-like metal-dependent hydrolase (beta-lactamase superfamily II)